MKYPLNLTLFLLLVIACRPVDTFTVSGRLQGLNAGDTLRFDTYTLPFYEPISADTFIVAENNTIDITIEAHHTIYGLLQYAPRAGKVWGNNSAEIIARPGDNIEIHGSIDYLKCARLKGGLYDDTAVARYLDTAREMDSLETFYERKIACFSESGQSDSAFSYIERFQHMKHPKAYKEMRDSLTNLADNEYAAYLYLRLTHRKSPEELQERLNRFSPATRESYLGKSLESMLPILTNISEGNKPKDFTLTDKNENSVSLSDYRGKYLLIFYYGVCGGVFQTDPHLTDIYHEYHDKGLEMLGICRDGDIAAAYPQLLESPQVQRLLDHPYPTIYLTDEQNAYIRKELFLYATPTVMLIDSEGTTLIRGSHEETAIRKLLHENL